MSLETARLYLEKPLDGQIDLVAPLFADPNVMRYIGSGETRTREQTIKVLEKNKLHWDTFGFGFFNVFEKITNEFVGRCGLIHFAYQFDSPDIELGFILHQKFWGKGYATEIGKGLVKWGFENIDIEYLLGVAYKENVASQKMLKKIGMHFDREDYYPTIKSNAFFFKIIKNF